jgi:serine/threonine-protein kinase
VERAKGGPARAVDGTQKIAELIDMMLLEFKSLTKEPTAGGSGLSLLPTLEGAAILTHGAEHPSSPPPRSEGPLGGLADELEGPDSLHQDESSSSVTAWFRGLIPR